MEAINRIAESWDWISIILFSSLLALAVVRQLSSVSFTEFLSVYSSTRFIKITRDDRIDNYYLLQQTGIILYTIGISLMAFKLYMITGSTEAGFTDFLLLLTTIAAFLLFRHYLSKLVATIGDFDPIILTIDHHRNLYRAAFSITFLVVNAIIFYVIPNKHDIIYGICIATLGLFFLYHLILIYSHRKSLGVSLFYFILYLCTLEIAPYLLLYKYFIV
ncbi:DUF4271 domain-containing protein [Nonlabens marinus]|uniref:DUF4271 domain-containing protein n=1 Tax=Nonlabens marinus S1-08 TaxID=1454201 RepID=W8VV60_9FLAO|nr:DUF4271 domain-containing protein [Nonlabens marinus]BAO55153.1 hypothetical protein NMS_1144 [Nonlabens marinus S1-08]